MKKLKYVLLISLTFFLCLTILVKLHPPVYEKPEKTQEEQLEEKKEPKKEMWMIKVNDKIYQVNGKSKRPPTCGTGMQEILKSVPETEIPSENETANFSGKIRYLYFAENHVEVLVDTTWYEFISKE